MIRKNFKNHSNYFFLVLGALITSFKPDFARAQIFIPQQPIPGQPPVTIPELQYLLVTLGNFLIIVGPIIFVISLVLSGIWYMKAGADPGAVAKAKSWFWYSILGGLIIFGSGVIVNTVAGIVTREFFCRVGFMGICIFN